jgi:hypothetical protein
MRRNTPGSVKKRRLWLAVAMVSVVLATLLQWPSSVYAAANPVRPAASRSTAPVKLPLASGEPAPKQPKKLPAGEQPDLRTRFSSTRYNADHTFTTTTSVHPVNYRVANGGWQPIDNSLVASRQKGYAYQNGANSFQTQFKSQLGDDYLRWVVDGQAVSMSLQGASHSQASTKKGSSLQYPGALAHVNASYNVVGDGLEEVLELQDASAQSSFQFLLKTPKGTTASQQADGSWAFALPGRAPATFWLKAPFAYDSGVQNLDPGQSHAQISAKETSGGFQVTLSVDAAWLRDPSRVFPVFVDPTLTIQPDTLDTTFEANCPNCTGFVASSGRMFIGADSTFAYREALRFDLSSIPAGVSVTGASLGVFYDQACIAVSGNKLCGGNNHQIDVHRRQPRQRARGLGGGSERKHDSQLRLYAVRAERHPAQPGRHQPDHAAQPLPLLGQAARHRVRHPGHGRAPLRAGHLALPDPGLLLRVALQPRPLHGPHHRQPLRPGRGQPGELQGVGRPHGAGRRRRRSIATRSQQLQPGSRCSGRQRPVSHWDARSDKGWTGTGEACRRSVPFWPSRFGDGQE